MDPWPWINLICREKGTLTPHEEAIAFTTFDSFKLKILNNIVQLQLFTLKDLLWCHCIARYGQDYKHSSEVQLQQSFFKNAFKKVD